MKKALALVLAVLMCVGLFAGCGQSAAPATTESAPAKTESAPAKTETAAAPAKEEAPVLKIGILEPQTGSSSFVGANQTSGIKAALEDWVEHFGNPGGCQIELVIGDSQGSADVGVTEAERLITEEKCAAIIGTYNSGVAAAVAPVCIKYKTPFMVVNAVADSICQDNSNYVFRANVGDTVSANNGWEYNVWLDEQLGSPVRAYIYDSGDWGQGSHDSTLKTWKDRGASWIDNFAIDETVDTGVSDFSTLLAKLKAANVQYLQTALYLDDCILLTRQLKEQNMNIIVTGAGGLMSADFLPAVGTDADYFLVSGSWVYDPKQLGEDALAVEQTFLKNTPGAVSVDEPFANGWLGMYCLLHAIDDCASNNNEEIAAALDKMDLENVEGERAFLFHPTMPKVKFEDQMGTAGFMVYNQNWYATSCYCQIQNGAYATIFPLNDKAQLISDIPAWNER